MIAFKVFFILFFANIVNAPVISVDVDNTGTLALSVESDITRKAGQHRIAEQRKVTVYEIAPIRGRGAEFSNRWARLSEMRTLVVIPRVAQDKAFKWGDLFVRKKLMLNPSRTTPRPGEYRERLLRVATGSPATEDLQS